MMKCDPGQIRKILIVTLSNLGDVILTLPVFQSLNENFPKAEIHVVVGPFAREVFERDSRITKIIPYDKKSSWLEKFKFLQEVRRERYSLIVDLRHSLIGLLGKAKYRNSYLNFSTHTTHQSKKHSSALKNIVREHSNQVSFLRIDPLAAETVDRDLLKNGQKIVVAAVGSKSDIKKWPAEYYAGLLDRLAVNDQCKIVLVGDKKDTADVENVKGFMRSRAIDLCGKTNFNQLCAVLKEASLLITNDSAPLHIADALKTPVLAIFGPTDPRKYGPRQAGSLAARRPLFCSPCEKAQCRYHHECMKELGIEEIYQKALQILNDEFQPKNLKILIIRLDRMGDVVLSLPAVQAVRNRFPNAVISMMVRPYTRELVDGHPAIDEVITYAYGKNGRHRSIIGNLRFLREMIKRHFDIAFILHPSNRSMNVPFFTGIPYRVGFKSKWPFLLTQSVMDRRHEGLKHESEYALDIIRAFGINQTADLLPHLTIYPYEEAQVLKLLEAESCGPDDEIIAFHPGASCISKKWPLERFAELGKKILQGTSYRLAIIGGAEEKASGDFLKKELGDDVMNLAGKLNLKILAAVLKRCRLLVSNDSGPVHVAAAVGTRTLTIFGRNQAGLSSVRWRALGEGHVVIQKDVGCVVCLAHRCSIGFECLKAVEVDEVYDHVRRMISMAGGQILMPKRISISKTS